MKDLLFISCRPRAFGKEQNKGIGCIILSFSSGKRLSAVITFIGEVKDQFIPKQFLLPFFPERRQPEQLFVVIVNITVNREIPFFWIPSVSL